MAIEKDEGKAIVEAAGDARAVILQNHGLLTMGKTIDEAAYLFMLMEKHVMHNYWLMLLSQKINQNNILLIVKLNILLVSLVILLFYILFSNQITSWKKDYLMVISNLQVS